jgi:hypothetical protein
VNMSHDLDDNIDFLMGLLYKYNHLK